MLVKNEKPEYNRLLKGVSQLVKSAPCLLGPMSNTDMRNVAYNHVYRLTGKWIGLSHRHTQGTLRWIDGTVITSGTWLHNMPDDGTLRCVIFDNDGAEMTIQSCDEEKLSVCQSLQPGVSPTV